MAKLRCPNHNLPVPCKECADIARVAYNEARSIDDPKATYPAALKRQGRK